MWDLPRPGLELMSSALAGGFLTTVPPGKPPGWILVSVSTFYLLQYHTSCLWRTTLYTHEAMWIKKASNILVLLWKCLLPHGLPKRDSGTCQESLDNTLRSTFESNYISYKQTKWVLLSQFNFYIIFFSCPFALAKTSTTMCNRVRRADIITLFPNLGEKFLKYYHLLWCFCRCF